MTGCVVYRISQVCEMLGISRQTFYRRVKAGDLQIHKFGRMTFVKREGVQRLLETVNGVPPDQPPALARDVAKPVGAAGNKPAHPAR